ncbi:MAG: zinc-ribbon domain-containing protein [Lachnospiraceae bacterium]|nr:zinc-ribbon domain-containing protein [Lachnospiraceae bacterium]
MAFCGKCGTKYEDGARFCPSCGADTTVSPQQADIRDAQDNKAMGILAYLGPLVLVPIFAAKESPFAQYHANQGLVLCLAAIAYSVAYSILSAIILAISWRLYFVISILGLVGILFTVLAVLGIVNVCKGEMKPLPLIGGIKILK